MKWHEKLGEAVKKTIRSWLNLQETNPLGIQINETVDFEVNAIRNRIWYRGDSDELQQLYGQFQTYADRYKFWASVPTPGFEIRKIHTGLPQLIVKTLVAIVISDMNDIILKSAVQQVAWEQIEADNHFKKLLGKALREVYVVGDGAFKISIDPELSNYPVIEFIPGERVELVLQRGRVFEVIFKTRHSQNKKAYTLHEHYGYGYVDYTLYEGDKEIDIKSLESTENLVRTEFDDALMLAVPMRVFDSAKWEGRGQSVFDGKIDSFDSFDEVWSQWMEALRAGRSKTYIPESLIPRDPDAGDLLKVNPFDNQFISISSDKGEDAINKIEVEQPNIPHDSYLSSYVTGLDLCLQGIISPSTLGIDVKKLDNAEAQREKEKTTLYTRNATVEAVQETLPLLVASVINAYNLMRGKGLETVESEIPFGEYANPSFESQVETVGKAHTLGIMSIEASVEELYGDSAEEDWKAEEVARIKREAGIMEAEEPTVFGQDAGLDNDLV